MTRAELHAELARRGPCDSGTLARALRRPAPNVYRLLVRLEDEGLVRRDPRGFVAVQHPGGDR